MNNKKLALLTFVIVFSLTANYFVIDEVKSSEVNVNDNNRYGPGFRYNIQGWVYLHIEGEPYERGYQYGYLCSNEIMDMITRWSNLAHDLSFMRLFAINDISQDYETLSEQWWNICRDKSMEKFFNQVPEEYVKEMQGMTDGLKAKNAKIFGRDVDMQDVFASQFVQEIVYTFSKWNKGIHPVKSFINGIKELVTGGILEHNGHCNVIIATGDATKNGEIVVAHETVFSPYIAQRCNFIVDMTPSSGNRFIMACPPGSLWSQEDWYQNEKGIILTETELVPQGPWKIRGNIPKGVRSRTAIQYSENIDEVIEVLKEGNNGLIPNEWIIGDIKTGEIASYQQALYNTPIKRTFNGYYQSNCYPQNINVLSEISGAPKIFLKMYSRLFGKNALFKIEGENILWREKVFQKLKEMGEKYYGEIDGDIAKQIMSASPIADKTTDCKITTTKLMQNLGMIIHMGVPNGEEWIPDEEIQDMFRGVTSLPANGWLEIYPPKGKEKSHSCEEENTKTSKTSRLLWACSLKEENYKKTSISYYEVSRDFLHVFTNSKNTYVLDKKTGERQSIKLIDELEPEKSGENNIVNTGFFEKNVYAFNIEINKKLWDFKAGGEISAPPVVKDDDVYFSSWDGNVYSIDLQTGEKNWIFQTGWSTVTKPVLSDDLVLFGSLDNKFYAIDKGSGDARWIFPCNAAIKSTPTTYGEYVFFGCDDGVFYALEKDTGNIGWKFKPAYSIEDNKFNNYLTTPIVSDPIIDDGVVYISVEDTIYALDTQTNEIIAKDINKNLSEDYTILGFFSLLLIVSFLIIVYMKKYKK